MAVLFTEFEKAKDQQAKLMERTEYQLVSEMSFGFPIRTIGRLENAPGVKALMTRAIKLANNRSDVVVQSAAGRRILSWRRRVSRFVVSKRFVNCGVAATVANIVVLAVDHHDIPVSTKQACEIVNFTFMMYFGVESALKIFGMGFTRFWRDKFNRFDLLTFVMGVIEAAVNPPSFVDGTVGSSGFFTAFRAARVFKLARMWKSLNQLLSAILQSLGEILNFMLFLVLFLLIFSLVGMELFATRYQFNPDNYSMPFNNSNPQTRLHRSNFDSLPWAAFTVFQLLTYDNFPAVMYDGWISVGAWSPVYVSIVIVLGVFIVMNMFSAILVQSVMDGNGDVLSEPSDDDDFAVDSQSNGTSSVTSPSSTNGNDHRRTSIGLKSARITKKAMRKLLRLHLLHAFQPPRHHAHGPPAHLVHGGKSLFLFSHKNPVRLFCCRLLNRREYTWVMSTIIFVSCVGTALDSPLQDSTTGLGLVLDTSNLVFAVLFSIEMALNVIARGLLFGPDAFVKDSWRLLDGFIVFVSHMFKDT
ncbi:hypothetical protein H310_08551 [Aphanomyces invadans]|uniref:Ion transport domain-containing protein n=1 Tax=Aphanomyces invadans TaxID=157072 RepID=A0A024U0K2_9STRA|nr:hypothetical protein H310_08551 [Aphanomyces invadans]ETV99147.1 hypothetical protein H310_08551 [Aphanomyces invadans]|eukprot:XP_008872575.1 hypothetical protein H310_08551 [Aphanomyces invadans]